MQSYRGYALLSPKGDARNSSSLRRPRVVSLAFTQVAFQADFWSPLEWLGRFQTNLFVGLQILGFGVPAIQRLLAICNMLVAQPLTGSLIQGPPQRVQVSILEVSGSKTHPLNSFWEQRP